MKATNIIELEFNNQDERTAFMNAQANNIKHYATYVKGGGEVKKNTYWNIYLKINNKFFKQIK